MKKIKGAILGYGDRSFWYSQYALDRPEEFEIIAVIDVNKFKLDNAKKRFNLPDEMLFSSLDEFLSKDIACDVVINGTMDNLHYETTIKLLNKKYNILLEKPITSNPDELLEIESLANKNGCKVVVCHVLRYTPFFRKIKEIMDTMIEVHNNKK
jgi:predicted dehydrogenase